MSSILADCAFVLLSITLLCGWTTPYLFSHLLMDVWFDFKWNEIVRDISVNVFVWVMFSFLMGGIARG